MKKIPSKMIAIGILLAMVGCSLTMNLVNKSDDVYINTKQETNIDSLEVGVGNSNKIKQLKNEE